MKVSIIFHILGTDNGNGTVHTGAGFFTFLQALPQKYQREIALPENILGDGKVDTAVF